MQFHTFSMSEISYKKRYKFTKMYFLLVLYRNNWNPLTVQVINSPKTSSWHFQQKEHNPDNLYYSHHNATISNRKIAGFYNCNDTLKCWVMMHLNIQWWAENWFILDSWHLGEKQLQLWLLDVTWKIHHCVIILNIRVLFTGTGSQRREEISFGHLFSTEMQYIWKNFNTFWYQLRLSHNDNFEIKLYT